MSVTARDVSETLDRLMARKKAYQGIPQDVLDDLAGFCRAERTCWAEDARLHALLEGRRETYLRIQEHLQLTPEDLLVLYSGGELHVDMLKGTEYAR
jgi:hypothetical protein